MLINGVNTMLRVVGGGIWAQLEQREHQEENDLNE
jgi:hypothetical protein